MPARVSIESYYEDVDCSILIANAPVYTIYVAGLIVAELTS